MSIAVDATQQAVALLPQPWLNLYLFQSAAAGVLAFLGGVFVVVAAISQHVLASRLRARQERSRVSHLLVLLQDDLESHRDEVETNAVTLGVIAEQITEDERRAQRSARSLVTFPQSVFLDQLIIFNDIVSPKLLRELANYRRVFIDYIECIEKVSKLNYGPVQLVLPNMNAAPSQSPSGEFLNHVERADAASSALIDALDKLSSRLVKDMA